MRDLREVPHSTERCKITTFSAISQAFVFFSLYNYVYFCKSATARFILGILASALPA